MESVASWGRINRVSNAGWVVIVPIKPLERGKTRLRGAVPDAAHPDLVLAMAMDTVTAATACAAVSGIVVVTDDARVRAALSAAGAHCVPDRPGQGLNAALRFCAATATGPVAALTADLPALRPTDLARALGRLPAPQRAFVADAGGLGTVLLTAPSAAEFDPHFGPDSAAAHRASGAIELRGGWQSLRRDVDTPADLAAAIALGLGPTTTAVLNAGSAERADSVQGWV